MSVLSILSEIESVRGSNAKLAILDEHSKNPLLRQVLVASMDPSLTYYVTNVNVDEHAEEDELLDDDTYVEIILETLGKLSSRTVTGNAAKDIVRDVLRLGSQDQACWFKRILLKNLRIGLNMTSINKVFPNLIVPFSVMLAHTLRTEHVPNLGLRIIDKVQYPVRVEPKLDGLRLITTKINGIVTMYTRNGTIIQTLPAIARAIADAPVDNVVIDGEAMGKDWNESASVMMSKTAKKDDSCMVYNVFDILSSDQWAARDCRSTMQQRSDMVKVFVDACGSDKVVQVEHVIVNDEESLKHEFAKFMSVGYEGVMVKDLNAPYQWTRSKSIMKLKPVMTYEGVVVALHRGRVGTKNEDVLSGMLVELSNGVRTRVGSGLNDSHRADMQLDPKRWIGLIVECEAQPDPLTADGLTVDGKMRFPIFVRERNEGDVSDDLRDLSRRVKHNNVEIIDGES